MSRKEGQKAKIIVLLQIFQQKTDEDHRLTVPQLEQLLKEEGIPSERKSIYTDIAALQAHGYEIELVRGPGGGYFLQNRDFELAEVEILVDAVQNSRFITKNKSRTLIKKLSSLASEYQAKGLARQVFVSGRVKNMNESVYYYVDALHRAIAENNTVRFEYFTRNVDGKKIPRSQRKVREVSPWALAWENNNYYLIAYQTYDATPGMRHYRVDRMSLVTQLDAPREGQQEYRDFDLAAYTKKQFNMYSGKDVRVTLRCENYCADAMLDRFGDDVMMLQEADGAHFHFDATVSVSPQFFGWVAGFAGSVVITAPAETQTEMKAFLDTLADGYREV